MDNDTALKFIAGPARNTSYMTAADSDFASWLVMSGDLLGSSRNGNFFETPDPNDFLREMDDSFISPAGMQVPVPIAPPDGVEPGMFPMEPAKPEDTNPNNTTHEGRAASGAAGAPAPHPATRTRAGAAPLRSMSMNVHNSANNHLNNMNGVNSAQNGNQGPVKMDPVSRASTMGSEDGLSEAGASSTTTTTATTTTKPSTKKQQRLEKNREIARNCRKRKREKYQKLEEEVLKLRQYNKQLEKQLNKGGDGRDRETARKAKLMGMKKLLENKCSDAEMKTPITEYEEMYSDFGRERNAAIMFHMSQLKALLVPNTVSKMTLWSLQQDDEFYDEKKNQKTFGGGIWNMLSSELRFTNEQKSTLLGMRHGIRSQRRNVAECLRILSELENRVSANFESMSKQMKMVMGTITPTQQARFLLWIEQNKACTFMLNDMFKHNQPEADTSVTTGTDEEFDDASSITGMSVGSSFSAKKARVASKAQWSPTEDEVPKKI